MLSDAVPSAALPNDLLKTPQWQRRIDLLASKHHVPGAQIGVISLASDENVDARVLATGVTSQATGVDVTDETLFQYGSISKVWTATLIMQLIDEDKLSLDTRVVEVLPEFRLSTAEYADQVTVRHLLTHTSGIEGDLATDTGDGDDCIERYVAGLSSSVSITAPGGHLSYCNSGFVVAGRIIEVLRGKAWDDVLVDHIYQPLGLAHVITRAKEAPLFRTAVGHLVSPDQKVVPTSRWMIPRSMGPAGIITGSVGDLLVFAAAHLRDGLGLNNVRILSPESSRMMREQQVSLRAVSSTEIGWGLGWCLDDWGAETSATHDGGTIGQISDLHIFPQSMLAIAILTNSSGGGAFIKELEELIGSELGLTMPRPKLSADVDQFDITAMAGTYSNNLSTYRLERDSDGVSRLTMRMASLTGDPDRGAQIVTPLGTNRFLVGTEGDQIEIAHLRDSDREYLYAGRLLQREAEEGSDLATAPPAG